MHRGPPPYGYTYHILLREYVPEPDEQATIALVRELRGLGFTLDQIASELAARRLYTRAGTPFGRRQLQRILARP